jgi:hypothetical protein
MVFRFGKNRILELELVKILWKRAARDFVPLRFDSNFSLKGDHAPSLYADAYLLNVRLFSIHCYDNRHEDAR